VQALVFLEHVWKGFCDVMPMHCLHFLMLLERDYWYPRRGIQFPEATPLPLELYGAALMKRRQIKLHSHVSVRIKGMNA